MPFLSAIQPEAALVRLGPGGDFVTDLRPEASGRLRRVAASAALSDRDSTPDNSPRNTPKDACELSALAMAMGSMLAAERTLAEQDVALATILASLAPFRAAPMFVPARDHLTAIRSVIRSIAVPIAPTAERASASSFGVGGGRLSQVLTVPDVRSRALRGASGGDGPPAVRVQEGSPYESDSQATAHSSVDPRLPRAAWLFADHAGTRRPDRRQQGHGVRARRGAYQERRPHTRSQQGSLFVDR